MVFLKDADTWHGIAMVEVAGRPPNNVVEGPLNWLSWESYIFSLYEEDKIC